MKWSKSPPELIEAFDAVLPGPPVERRQMFGYPAAFVNGNMVCGLFQDGLVLRLDEGDRKKLLQVKGCEPFAPMPGKKSMGAFILVPGSMVADEDAITPWLERALGYVSKMPPKQKKKKAAPEKKKAAPGKKKAAPKKKRK